MKSEIHSSSSKKTYVMVTLEQEANLPQKKKLKRVFDVTTVKGECMHGEVK